MSLERYPKELFAAVARDILGKNSGEKLNSFSKQANVIDYRNQFLQDYGLKPEDFAGDRIAQRFVNEKKKPLEQQINNFYDMQARAGGSLTPEMRQAQRESLERINQQAQQAALNFSIDRTRSIANEQPDAFKKYQRISGDSEQALSQVHGKELGTLGGGLLGAGLGAVVGGKKLPKKNTGLLQKGLGGVVGGALGGITGNLIGSARDEKKTGYNHEDILKPYEIADRVNRQSKLKG